MIQIELGPRCGRGWVPLEASGFFGGLRNPKVVHLRRRKCSRPHMRAFSEEPPLLKVENVGFRIQGSPKWILKDISMTLPNKSLGVIFGRSGSGKTTLLQILSGLSSPTEGTISMIDAFQGDGILNPAPSTGGASKAFELRAMDRADIAKRAGLVFQFPERYFLTSSILEELSFGWPRGLEDFPIRLQLAARVQNALAAVGLLGLPLDTDPRALSGGNQRRLALAVQLVRLPELVLLDEPLAGLDWMAREDVVRLLAELKKQRAVLIVSHDLKEIAPLVDRSWHMRYGGSLHMEDLPSDVSSDEE